MSKDFLDTKATTECRFTLKRVRDMARIYSHPFGIKIEMLIKRLLLHLQIISQKKLQTGKKVFFVADLNRFYEELVNDLIDDESDISYNARKVEGTILNYFGDQIQLVRAKTIRGNLICDKKYTTEEAIRFSDKQNIQIKIRDVALFLRREVLLADYRPLSNSVSLEDIRKGEVNTPEDMVKFFRYFVGRPYVGRELTGE